MKTIVTALAIMALVGCSRGAEDQAEYDACVARGVQYFKDMGSFPTLTAPPNQGRSADSVARERCNRTPTAF